MGAACAWLDFAWRNSPSVALELRVLALYSGFEALFGPVARQLELGRRVSKALEPSTVGRRARTWHPRADGKGASITERLSDLEWWFIRFADLRNHIAHGHDVPRSLKRHGRRWQFWIAEERLRQAITHKLIEYTGMPPLGREFGERLIAWAVADWVASQR